MSSQETPYYLKPNSDITQNPIGTIDVFNYDTLQGSEPAKKDQGLWESLSESVSTAGNYIWDPIEGVWTSTKELASNALSSAQSGIESAISSIKWNLILLVAGGLLVIWIIAKSGIIKQVSLLKP